MRHLKIFEEFLAEAANFKTLKAMLEDIAKETNTVLRETKKTPISARGYDGGMMYNYIIGNVEIVVKNVKVPGAPRLNGVDVFVLIEPGADKGKKFTDYDDFRGLKDFVKKKIEESAGSSSSPRVSPEKSWTRAEIEKLISDLKERDEHMDDAQLFDIADGVFRESPGLENSIKRIFLVSDPMGWFVNKIA